MAFLPLASEAAVLRVVLARDERAHQVDDLAREVIAPGTPGAAAVRERFPDVVRDGAVLGDKTVLTDFTRA